jgi:protein phosphatase 2C family protein 2/3
MQGRKLTVANAGDSRAVLARRCPMKNEQEDKIKAIDLSIDQNPDSPGEQQRIESCGGYVSPPPDVGLSARVWLDPEFTHIGLAMGRSLGDHAVKSVGVISEPVVSFHQLTDEDEFMIIATDGVWEFITSEEAVQIVAQQFHNGEEAKQGEYSGATAACRDLIETAAKRWAEHEGDYRDDITAVVVKTRELWDMAHT